MDGVRILEEERRTSVHSKACQVEAQLERSVISIRLDCFGVGVMKVSVAEFP
jgi:hypothetical protein